MTDNPLAPGVVAPAAPLIEPLLRQRIKELQEALDARHREKPIDDADYCQGCGGRYRFDTSVPSVLWNQVIRVQGLPEYLCVSCILREFVRVGTSFTAELYGDGFSGVPIELRIRSEEATASQQIQDENNVLRWKSSRSEARSAQHAAALSKLVKKLDAMETPLKSLCVIGDVHGMPYTGPNWGEEVEAAKALLAAADPAPPAQED